MMSWIERRGLTNLSQLAGGPGVDGVGVQGAAQPQQEESPQSPPEPEGEAVQAGCGQRGVLTGDVGVGMVDAGAALLHPLPILLLQRSLQKLEQLQMAQTGRQRRVPRAAQARQVHHRATALSQVAALPAEKKEPHASSTYLRRSAYCL